MNLRTHASAVLREEIVSAVLPCGLECRLVPKKGFTKKIGIFATRYGSIDLAFTPEGKGRLETPPGIAHFLVSGTGWATTRWQAVQRAAWDAL